MATRGKIRPSELVMELMHMTDVDLAGRLEKISLDGRTYNIDRRRAYIREAARRLKIYSESSDIDQPG